MSKNILNRKEAGDLVGEKKLLVANEYKSLKLRLWYRNARSCLVYIESNNSTPSFYAELWWPKSAVESNVAQAAE